MKAFTCVVISAVLATLLLSSLALAHSGATGIVKERMDIMSDVGKHMKAIAAIMKGETAFDGMAVKTSAQSMAAHANKIPHLFPEGSNNSPSKALPAIWQDWERFTKLGKDLTNSAGALATVAESANSPTDLKDALIAVGMTCKGCHEKFRMAK